MTAVMRGMGKLRSVATVAGLAVVCTNTPESREPKSLCSLVGSGARLPRVPEASGATIGRRSPGVVWTHNDSGDPVVIALDTNGRMRGVVRVAGARMIDWESVSAGPCASADGSCLYIADIGDNAARRREIVVYRVPEPAPGDQTTRGAEAFRASYPDGPRDAEALVVTADGGIFIITKGEAGPVAAYRFPQPLRAGATARLVHVQTLVQKPRKKDWVTDADVSPDGRWMVLRTPESLLFYRVANPPNLAFADPLVVDIRSLREPQGEGVALADDGSVYVTGEGGGKRQPGTFARLKCQLPQ